MKITRWDWFMGNLLSGLFQAVGPIIMLYGLSQAARGNAPGAFLLGVIGGGTTVGMSGWIYLNRRAARAS